MNDSTAIDLTIDVTLEAFERDVYSGDQNAAWHKFMSILRQMEVSGWVFELSGGMAGTNVEIRNKATRLVAAIVTLFVRRELVLPDQMLVELLYSKRFLSSTAAATDFGSFEHLLSLVGEKTTTGQIEIKNASSYNKFLAFCDLASAPPAILDIIKTLPDHLKYVFILSLIDKDVVLDEKQDQLRWQLFEMFDELDMSSFPSSVNVRMANVYMFSSYLHQESKHKIKTKINEYFQIDGLRAGLKLPQLQSRKNLKSKPVICLPLEHFKSNHAMYRCYANAIKALRDKFTLIAVVEKGVLDEVALELFDDVHTFDGSIKDAIGKIVKSKPDIVYYPSLGMKVWTIYASVLRLAPIQMMTLGHPATSMSNEMDYLINEEDFMGSEECYSETVLLIKGGALSFEAYPCETLPEPLFSDNQSVVNIAVPASLYKLNNEFISACVRISERAVPKVKFHFFTGVSGLHLLSLKNQLSKRLDAECYPRAGYEEYMKLVNQCDLQLSPFPFGNTNGFVDGLILGLPIVALDGEEAHQKCDIGLSNRARLPDICRASTLDGYVDSVVTLVNDHTLREKLSNEILEDSSYRNLVAHDRDDLVQDFADVFDFIYQNHEVVQGEGKKCWRVADREDFFKG